jgi:hypothetical protein
MKRLLTVLAVTVAILLAGILGCVPGIKSTKPTSDSDLKSVDKTAEYSSEETSKPKKLTQEDLEKMLPPPPPSYKKNGDGNKALPVGPKEMLLKEEINASALEFAKQIPGVIHVKTCFSKVFGGWYLHLYVKKGKKISLQHYTWNAVTKEWDVSLSVKELPLENLEHHVKGEVGDEKCTVLK